MTDVIPCRSCEEVTARLDRLIAKIHQIQAPHMNGDKAADVVLVRINARIGLEILLRIR